MKFHRLLEVKEYIRAGDEYYSEADNDAPEAAGKWLPGSWHKISNPTCPLTRFSINVSNLPVRRLVSADDLQFSFDKEKELERLKDITPKS